MIIEIPDSIVTAIADDLKKMEKNQMNKKYLSTQIRKKYEIIKNIALEAACKQISDIVGYKVELDDTYEWSYETGESIYFGRNEVVYNQVKFTKSEDEARELFKKDGRNYLLRKRQDGDKSIRQRWNESKNEWEDD